MLKNELMKNEIYSDENRIDEDIRLIRQLDEEDSSNSLWNLLRKSKELRSTSSIRLIDEHLNEIPSKEFSRSTKEIHLSCNNFKQNSLQWKHFPSNLRMINLSGNFLEEIDEIDEERNDLECLFVSFNDIRSIKSLSSWPNLTLIDLSYNLLTNLDEMIRLLKCLKQLRIVYLNGNPFSLFIDYRIRVLDELNHLFVFDDIRLTAEEKFRSRNFSQLNSDQRNYSLLTIRLSPIENVPPPTINQDEWPKEDHRYYLRWNWFDVDEKNVNEEKEIPFDRLSNYDRYVKKEFVTTSNEYSSTMNFSPNEFQMKIFNLISFRDFLFHRIHIEFVHQINEYWPPDDPNLSSEQKKKSAKDKKIDDDPKKKKKKNDDLSKLIKRKEGEEKILFDYFVDLRTFLDGDHFVRQDFQFNYQRMINEQNLSKGEKKNKKKERNSSNDIDKAKDKKAVIESSEENPSFELVTLKSSIEFHLHRYISPKEIL